MSDKFILYTQLKNYFEYLCGGGLKLQDFLDKENRDLDDIVNCFILILGLTLASICVFNFHNYLYCIIIVSFNSFN